MNEQQYQQQPPVQPQYQAQPPYQPQQPIYQPKPQGAGLAGFVDFMVKLLPVLIIVFLSMGALAVFYYFIMGIGNAISYGNFGSFVGGIANGLSAALKYVFYAAIMAIGAKRIKK